MLGEDEDGLADCKVVATVLTPRSLGASTVDVEVAWVTDVLTVFVDELVGD